MALFLLVLGVSCLDDDVFWNQDNIDQYDNYQVYRVIPTNPEAVHALKRLKSMNVIAKLYGQIFNTLNLTIYLTVRFLD